VREESGFGQVDQRSWLHRSERHGREQSGPEMPSVWRCARLARGVEVEPDLGDTLRGVTGNSRYVYPTGITCQRKSRIAGIQKDDASILGGNLHRG
jgi:hypothetical protein